VIESGIRVLAEGLEARVIAERLLNFSPQMKCLANLHL